MDIDIGISSRIARKSRKDCPPAGRHCSLCLKTTGSTGTTGVFRRCTLPGQYNELWLAADRSRSIRALGFRRQQLHRVRQAHSIKKPWACPGGR